MYQRNTIQRETILKTVKELQNHPTAEDVYAYIVTRYPNISRATVYRGLNELSQAGKLSKVDLPDGANHFDHLCHKHYHIKCVKCEKVFDVDMDYVENMFGKVKNDNGFKFLSYDIVFNGICPNCQKNKN